MLLPAAGYSSYDVRDHKLVFWGSNSFTSVKTLAIVSDGVEDVSDT